MRGKFDNGLLIYCVFTAHTAYPARVSTTSSDGTVDFIMASHVLLARTPRHYSLCLYRNPLSVCSRSGHHVRCINTPAATKDSRRRSLMALAMLETAETMIGLSATARSPVRHSSRGYASVAVAPAPDTMAWALLETAETMPPFGREPHVPSKIQRTYNRRIQNVVEYSMKHVASSTRAVSFALSPCVFHGSLMNSTIGSMTTPVFFYVTLSEMAIRR